MSVFWEGGGAVDELPGFGFGDVDIATTKISNNSTINIATNEARSSGFPVAKAGSHQLDKKKKLLKAITKNEARLQKAANVCHDDIIAYNDIVRYACTLRFWSASSNGRYNCVY